MSTPRDDHQPSLSRRAAFGALAVPGLAALAGCASTQGRSAAHVRDLREFAERPGSTIMESDGTRTFRNHELRDQDGRVLRFQEGLMSGQVFAASPAVMAAAGPRSRARSLPPPNPQEMLSRSWMKPIVAPGSATR